MIKTITITLDTDKDQFSVKGFGDFTVGEFADLMMQAYIAETSRLIVHHHCDDPGCDFVDINTKIIKAVELISDAYSKNKIKN